MLRNQCSLRQRKCIGTLLMLLNNAAQPVVCKYRYLTYATTTLLILLYVGICILLMLQQR
jgi:hypothetical protein